MRTRTADRDVADRHHELLDAAIGEEAAVVQDDPGGRRPGRARSWKRRSRGSGGSKRYEQFMHDEGQRHPEALGHDLGVGVGSP